MPAELTTVAGIRLKKTVRRLRPNLSDLQIVGLANEYLCYITTPEEYAKQDYEGAATLYGKYSSPVLNYLYDDMLRSKENNILKEVTYKMMVRKEFDVDGMYDNMRDVKEMFGNVIDFTDTSSYKSFSFNDEIPTMKEASLDPSIAILPKVTIETSDGNKWSFLENENNGNIVTTIERSKPVGRAWKVYWINPKNIRGTYRFKVQTVSNGIIISEPFVIE